MKKRTYETILIYCGIYWINILLGVLNWYSPIMFMIALTIVAFCYMGVKEVELPPDTLEVIEKMRKKYFKKEEAKKE